jgi:thiamine-phosphate diphosphorylase
MLVTEPMDRTRLTDVVRAAVKGGVNAVQLRDKTLSPYELTLTAAVLKLYLRDTTLLVNGCPSAAKGAHASGVHLPEQAPGIPRARFIVGSESLVGRSVHTVESAVRAERQGADYLVAGTIFASQSHPGTEPAGLGFLREVCAAVRIPVIAIGGVTVENCADCLHAGASGVAVLSAILRAADPHVEAMRYRRNLDSIAEV